jgi:hypothetical protein
MLGSQRGRQHYPPRRDRSVSNLAGIPPGKVAPARMRPSLHELSGTNKGSL